MSPDLVNGLLELAGAGFVGVSVRQLYIDKTVAGVSWYTPAFFSTCGWWNLYYYPGLEQWWSLGGSVGLVVANGAWMTLLLYYSWDWRRFLR